MCPNAELLRAGAYSNEKLNPEKSIGAKRLSPISLGSQRIRWQTGFVCFLPRLKPLLEKSSSGPFFSLQCHGV